jgi:hypothetical protein
MKKIIVKDPVKASAVKHTIAQIAATLLCGDKFWPSKEQQDLALDVATVLFRGACQRVENDECAKKQEVEVAVQD